jgi:[ribosomal protein S5]-alanine N-acetyltransferase
MIMLRTERLLLRDFQPGDEDAVHAYAGDPVVTRYTTWGPNKREDSDTFVRECAAQAHDPERDAFSLAVVDAGAVVRAGNIHVEDAANRRGELGFVLHPAVWNRGYATEIARELVRFGFTELGLHRIAATCDLANLASARALAKAGLTREGHLRDHLLTRGGWRDSLLYSVINPA